MLFLQKWISVSADMGKHCLGRIFPPPLHLLSAFTIFLTACASEVFLEPSALSYSNQNHARKYVVEETINIKLDSGYERKIVEGALFSEYGDIPQGLVLKPISTVFTVEGAHVHEAFPVIDNNSVVGFYLPVERAFSPLKNHVAVAIKER